MDTATMVHQAGISAKLIMLFLFGSLFGIFIFKLFWKKPSEQHKDKPSMWELWCEDVKTQLEPVRKKLSDEGIDYNPDIDLKNLYFDDKGYWCMVVDDGVITGSIADDGDDPLPIEYQRFIAGEWDSLEEEDDEVIPLENIKES